MTDITAPLYEIFSGIQGEGVHVGERQIFVRFCGCNWACDYCDTREACGAPDTCAIEREAGSRQCDPVPNPLGLGQVVDAVAALASGSCLHYAVSLTGGEPLVHADFVGALGAVLRRAGLAVCLETNGTLPDVLAGVVHCVDHVAMDVKLESATGQPTPWDAHRLFLARAASRDVEVKVVISAETTEGELGDLADLVASVDVATPVVLQPVTPLGGVSAPSAAQVLRLQDVLLCRLPHVRVIPQVHKLMGQK